MGCGPSKDDQISAPANAAVAETADASVRDQPVDLAESKLDVPPAASAAAVAEPPAPAGAAGTTEGAERLISARIDEVISAATAACAAPLALFGLLDSSHIWYLASTGMFRPCHDRCGTFCTHVLDRGDSEFVVEDASTDPRFMEHPSITGPPHLRFYAGVPLVSSAGHHVGTFAVFDFHTRAATPELWGQLRRLAARAVEELERDMHALLLPHGPSARAAVVVEVCGGAWNVVHGNAAWKTLIGCPPPADGAPESLWRLLATSDSREMAALQEAGRAGAADVTAILSTERNCSTVRQCVVTFFPATRDQLAKHLPNGLDWATPAGAAAAAPGGPPRFLCGVVDAVTVGQAPRAPPPGGGGGDSVSAPQALGVCASAVPPRFEGLELGELLGEGSSGRVYEGTLQGQAVAVKIIEFESGDDAVAQAWAPKFEGLISIMWSHPHLVPTLDFCVLPPVEPDEGAGELGRSGQAWIVQKLCTRGTVGQAIDSGELHEAPPAGADGAAAPPAPRLRLVLELARQVASGLAYLHSREMLHGDLNSVNVMLTDAEGGPGLVAMVTDFGLLRMAGAVNASSYSAGTVSHMPPELLADGLLSKATDVYALGVLVWEMYCGRHAWAGHSPARIIYAVTCAGERLALPPGAHPPLAALLDACLQTDHTKRPSCAEIEAALGAMVAAL